MDLETYEQPAIPRALVAPIRGYLKEGLEVKLTFYDNEPIDIDLPTSVDLLVSEAGVSIRGDTATGVNKKITLETGVKVEVPNFINEGDIIRIDTRTGKYLTRVTE